MAEGEPLKSCPLRGRSAVVTGGTGVLGQAIAARLRRDGARVACWDLRDGVDSDLALAVDVTDEPAVMDAMRRTVAALGAIDILVNNAGIQGPIAETSDLLVTEWRRILDINLTGTFICSRVIVPVMRERAWGRVINIASLRGKDGPPRTSAYNASKAGVSALKRRWSKPLSSHSRRRPASRWSRCRRRSASSSRCSSPATSSSTSWTRASLA